MQYGKLIGTEFIGSPIPQDGYLPVVFNTPTEECPDGKEWIYEWATDGETIYKVWSLRDYIEPIIEPSADELLARLEEIL